MMQNLDLECAKLGQDLAREEGVDEKLLNDAVAVLEEHGVYALFLYLNARGGRGADRTSAMCTEFLRTVPGGSPLLDGGNLFDSLQKLSQNIDDLLFARDLLRQVLVYGRYHVRARGAPAGGRG